MFCPRLHGEAVGVGTGATTERHVRSQGEAVAAHPAHTPISAITSKTTFSLGSFRISISPMNE